MSPEQDDSGVKMFRDELAVGELTQTKSVSDKKIQQLIHHGLVSRGVIRMIIYQLQVFQDKRPHKFSTLKPETQSIFKENVSKFISMLTNPHCSKIKPKLKLTPKPSFLCYL